MNRRAFLGWMVLAPVAGPATLKGMGSRHGVTNAVAVSASWVPIQWWEKEFDYGAQLGIAVAAQNTVTGKIRRNAVRFDIDPACLPGDIARAKDQLLDWIQRGAGIRQKGRRGGCVRDDVLEGREMRLPAGQVKA